MATPSSTENKGLMDKATGFMGDTLGKIADKPDEWADKIQDPRKREITRKALYILFDLGIVLLAFGVVSAMMGAGWNPLHWFSAANFTAIGHSLQNMSFMNMMTAGMGFGAIGLGLGFLVNDLLPKKAHRTAGKVMAVAVPFLLIGGAAALILAAGKTGGGHFLNMHFSLSKSMTSSLFYVGLLLIPVAAYSALKIPDVFKSQTPYVGNVRLTSRARQRRHHPLSGGLRRFERAEATRRDRQTETQRTHEGGWWSNLRQRFTPTPHVESMEDYFNDL